MREEHFATLDEEVGTTDVPRQTLPIFDKVAQSPANVMRHLHNKSACSKLAGSETAAHSSADEHGTKGHTNKTTLKASAKGAGLVGVVELLEAVYRNKGWTKLPSHEGFLNQRLQSLDLRENRLGEFPQELLQLSNLQILRLDNNQITGIPSGIVALTHLAILSLAQNDIRKLERNLGKLQQLSSLALECNKLEEWPEWLCVDCSRLRLLRLHGNVAIPTMPLTFVQMTQLEQFSFDWFLYILPAMDALLTGEKGKRQIEATRNLCKKLAQNSTTTSKQAMPKKVAPVVCTFLQFYAHFVQRQQGQMEMETETEKEKKTKKETAQHAYPKQRSALHVACKYGHRRIVQELIETNYNLNSLDVEGCTGLMLALRFSKIDCAKLLLKTPRTNVSLGATNGQHPIHVAIANGRYDLAELIAQHPSVDVADKDSRGNTALHLLFAVYDTFPLLIQSLCHVLVSNPKMPLNARNSAGLTPLHCAAKARQRLAIRFALEHNRKQAKAGTSVLFDLNAEGGDQRLSVVHDIAVHMDTETLRAVLETKVDLLARSSVGSTARDLIKNTLAAKLLLKGEKLQIRSLMRVHTQNFEVLNDPLLAQDADMLLPTTLATAVAAPTKSKQAELEATKTLMVTSFVLKSSKRLKSRRGTKLPECVEGWELEAESEANDCTVPVRGHANVRPLMFERIHMLSQHSHKPTVPSHGFVFHKSLQGYLQDADDKPVLKLDTNNAEPALALATEMPAATNLELDLANVDELLTAKQQISRCFFRPSIPMPNRNLGLSPRQPTGRKTCIAATRDDSNLDDNPHLPLYRKLMSGRLMYSRKCRLVYSLAAEGSAESDGVLILLCERLEDDDPLKLDVIYLLGLLRCHRALASLRTIQSRSQHRLVRYEACNAIRTICDSGSLLVAVSEPKPHSSVSVASFRSHNDAHVATMAAVAKHAEEIEKKLLVYHEGDSATSKDEKPKGNVNTNVNASATVQAKGQMQDKVKEKEKEKGKAKVKVKTKVKAKDIAQIQAHLRSSEDISTNTKTPKLLKDLAKMPVRSFKTKKTHSYFHININ